MSWEKLSDSFVFQRGLEELAEIWRAYSSGSYEEELPISEAVQSELDPGKKIQFSSEPGIRLNAIKELSLIQRKADTAFSGYGFLYQGGYCSWSTADAYHACLLHLRQLLGYCGFFVLQVNGRSYIADVFPEMHGVHRGREQFRREAKGIEHPVLWASLDGRKIEHGSLWQVFQRLVRVLRAPHIPDRDLRWARNFSFGKYHPVRNRIIYGGAFWPEMMDISGPLRPSMDLRVADVLANYEGGQWEESVFRDHYLLFIVRALSEYFRLQYNEIEPSELEVAAGSGDEAPLI